MAKLPHVDLINMRMRQVHDALLPMGALTFADCKKFIREFLNINQRNTDDMFMMLRVQGFLQDVDGDRIEATRMETKEVNEAIENLRFVMENIQKLYANDHNKFLKDQIVDLQAVMDYLLRLKERVK